MNHTASEANESIRYSFFLGALLTFVGWGLVALTWPNEDDGTSLLWVAALVLAVAGPVMVLVAAIGWGVSLGIRASGRFPDPVAPAAPPPTVPPVRRRRRPAEIAPLDPPR